MKSICVKTNNTDMLTYLENSLKKIDLDNIFFSCNEFKSYKNIIIHYKGKNTKLFYTKISMLLSSSVVDLLEHKITKRLICYNYFYFDALETNKILNICEENFNEQPISSQKFSLLYNAFYNYITTHRNIILNGFINFRTKDYLRYLNNIINESVNTFIIEREYSEFISLLKMYISTQSSTCEAVHLVYLEDNSILLDENKNPIIIDDTIFNAKYLSDITFSSHDYILNTLLTLLPQKIFIHLIDPTLDEFINTLQLVFEGRIEFCTECPICKLYNINKYMK